MNTDTEVNIRRTPHESIKTVMYLIRSHDAKQNYKCT